MRCSLPFLLLLALLFPLSGSATTIIPFKNLSELFLASDAVVVVKAGVPYVQTINETSHYFCDFTVVVSAKGPFTPNEVFSLRQYSFFDEVGRVDIAGDFVPQAGNTYLLFLDQVDVDGWRTMMLSYYVFAANVPGTELLVPVPESLSMGVSPRPDGVVPEPLMAYRKDVLLQLFAQQGTGANVPWDPSSAQVTLSALSNEVSDRGLPVGCDFDLGGGLSRWQNTAIKMYYDVTNAPPDSVTLYKSAINSVNTAYGGLNLLYSGATNFIPDCSDLTVAGKDFITYLNLQLNGPQSALLLFDDPCDLLPHLSNCSGVLSTGGSYTLHTTHTFKAATWKNSAWGFMIVNVGVRGCLSDTSYKQMLMHEMGHILKLDHLTPLLGSINNMDVVCCRPIGPKDRECMNYLYLDQGALPVELLAFDARVQDDAVTLSWSTAQEINNDYFTIERSGDGQQFEPLARITASNLAYVANYTRMDEHPLTGLNYYRLSQTDRDGHPEQLAMRSVVFRGNAGGYVIVPNPVEGHSIVLKSTNSEPALESLQIFNSAGILIFQAPENTDWNLNQLEVSINHLPTGVYWLKVNEAGHSETLKFVRL